MNFLLAEHTKNKVIDSRQRAHVVIYPMLAQGHMKTQDIHCVQKKWESVSMSNCT
jgi:hypothetical protein